MADGTEIDFLRQGLTYYPDARHTVDDFETMVTSALRAALEEKVWNNFQPLRTSDGGIEFAKATGTTDRFIHAWIAGRLAHRDEAKGKVWAAIGLYWNPPRRPRSLVVAASSVWAAEGGSALTLLDLPGRDKRVELGLVSKKNERRLIVEPAADFDAAEVFSLLLDSLDDALGPVV